MDEHQLWELIQKRELALYSPETCTRLEPMSNLRFVIATHGSLKNFISHYWFSVNDVELLEQNSLQHQVNVAGKKLRPNQFIKEQCRAMAKLIWKSNPTMTIEDMIKESEIINLTKKKDKSYYLEKTIRNWIKDLCPNRRPGRRPKPKS